MVDKLPSGWVFSVCLMGFLVGPAAADVLVNEVLAANQDTNADRFKDSPDWAELVNTGADPVDLNGYWLSDDPQQAQKWQFPPVTLAAGEHRIVWCSGRNQTVAPAKLVDDPEITFEFTASIVSLDAEWRYLTGLPEETGPPPDWFRPEFDDAAWGAGMPGIGLGDDMTTVLSEGISLACLRHTFHVDDPSAVPALVFHAIYSDGFVLYLNGVRVVGVLYDDEADPTFASKSTGPHSSRTAERFDLSEHRELLRAGDNVIGIALLNLRASSSTFRIVPQLGEVEPLLHTNFQLNSDGDGIFLADPDGRIIDGVVFPRQASDRSYGRSPDATGDFLFMLQPTPGEANGGRTSTERIGSKIEFSPLNGVLDEPTEVTLTAQIPFEGYEIRYTTDGEAVTTESTLYEGPIAVTDDTVLRAVVLLEGETITRELTKSYFVSDLAQALALPIISVIMDPNDFESVHVRNVRGRRGEKPAHMEIFDAAGEPDHATGFGLRLHGGAGREGGFQVKKAYRAYFRTEYGDRRLRYPIIPDTEVDSFDKLVLRSNFNDSFRWPKPSLIRDQLIRDLHKEMGGVISHGSWYNLFVNGAYRGLYNVVERMDKDFFASYFPEDDDNWDVIKYPSDVLDGTPVEWNAFGNSILRSDLSDDSLFDEVAAQVNVDTFTSYMILEIWSQNHDWPTNNWYAARPRRRDGEWIFLVWDAEFGVGQRPDGFDNDTVTWVFRSEDDMKTGAPSAVWSSLLANRRYQEFFFEELDRYFSENLSAENVLAHIDRLVAIIEPDIAEEAGGSDRLQALWAATIEGMRLFAKGRVPEIRRFLQVSDHMDVPAVVGVMPEEILLEGPQEVTLETVRATAATEIFFNDLPATDVVFVRPTQMRATVPFDARLEGTPTIRISDPKNGQTPVTGLLTVSLSSGSVRFSRGDADGNGRMTVSDAVVTLRWIFGLVDEPPCVLALDTDDSGTVNVTDAIVIANYLFRSQAPPPAAPFPDCGRIAEAELSCQGPVQCR